jgi:hypothetical protein
LLGGTLFGGYTVSLPRYGLGRGLGEVRAVGLEGFGGAGVRHYFNFFMLLIEHRGIVMKPPLELPANDAQMTMVFLVFLTRNPMVTI